VRVAPRIVLSDGERSQLTSWARGRSTPHRVVLRARIVLRAADGAQNQQIAEELSTEPNTCALWRRRFLAARLPGLMNDAPRAGGPLLVPDSKIRAIVHDTLHTKPPSATHWSTRSMAATHGVSASTVRRIWAARRLTPHRLEHYKLSRDKHFEEKLRDVVGLYLNPPEHALVLSVDEKTQIQALDRTQSILPLREGVPERQTHDYRRNGTTDRFAALDVAEGTVIGECHKRHRAREFLAFLRTLDRSTPPELDLHLILDNLATHKTVKVKRWGLRHPRFHFHFVPTSSSWLNQVERWFNDLTQKRVRRGTFRSEHELIEALKQYVETYNEHPRPFQWRATADSILAKVRWNRLNVELAGAAH
jgi:transposase